jgi:hypothetical protein
MGDYSEAVARGGGSGPAPPKTNLYHEWMENLTSKNLGIVRPARVLVAGTVEDHMTVEHKVSEKQLAAGGYDPPSSLVCEEDCGSPH